MGTELKVPRQHRKDIAILLSKNKDLFAKSDMDLGQTDTVKMKLDTGNHAPIPLTKRKVIDKAVDEMLKAKVIERSQSPWSSPLLLVKKQDGTDKACVDFRALNKIIMPIAYPLPVIDNLLANLGSTKFFSTLDLRGIITKHQTP